MSTVYVTPTIELVDLELKAIFTDVRPEASNMRLSCAGTGLSGEAPVFRRGGVSACDACPRIVRIVWMRHKTLSLESTNHRYQQQAMGSVPPMLIGHRVYLLEREKVKSQRVAEVSPWLGVDGGMRPLRTAPHTCRSRRRQVLQLVVKAAAALDAKRQVEDAAHRRMRAAAGGSRTGNDTHTTARCAQLIVQKSERLQGSDRHPVSQSVRRLSNFVEHIRAKNILKSSGGKRRILFGIPKSERRDVVTIPRCCTQHRTKHARAIARISDL